MWNKHMSFDWVIWKLVLVQNYLACHHKLSTKRVINTFASFCLWTLTHNFVCHHHLFQCEDYWAEILSNFSCLIDILMSFLESSFFQHVLPCFFCIVLQIIIFHSFWLCYASFTSCPWHPVIGQREKYHWPWSRGWYFITELHFGYLGCH